MKALWVALASPFAWRMAWRDARRQRRQLLLFGAAMTLGTAALVAVASFTDNLRAVVDTEAKTLLGADMRLRSQARWDDASIGEVRATLAGQGGFELSRQTSFSSMAAFPDRNETRLVMVRAMEGRHPYYGTLETTPLDAAERFREGVGPVGQPAGPGMGALVDDGMMLQFGSQVGDTIAIGDRTYPILGRLRHIPGETAASAFFGPRVYVPRAELDPGLLVRGSRVTDDLFVKLDAGVDVALAEEALRPLAGEEDSAQRNFRITTMRDRQEGWADRVEMLYTFLGLVGFVSLLLGGLGIASAMNAHARRQLGQTATLRCLGATPAMTLAVRIAQVLLLGSGAAVLGAGIGVGSQHLLPLVLADFLPVDVPVLTSPTAILTGFAAGLAGALLFALLPLASLRHVPPLAALRAAYEPAAPKRDLVVWGLRLLVVLAVFGYATAQAGSWKVGAGFTGGAALVLGLLAGTARGLMAATRRWTPRTLSYPVRQGLANLHRPHNQTTALLVTLGLGAFLVLTLALIQGNLLATVTLSAEGEQPNLILFDVQDGQTEGLAALIEDHALPVLQQVPIINMRLLEVKGRTVTELREERRREADDGGGGRGGWAYSREYRSTYRDTLTDTEEIVDGSFTPQVGPGEVVPISLEKEIADQLGVGVGDALVFDVQGLAVSTVVGSLREVDWKRVQPNFFAVFPTGVLEQAPKFHVLVTRTPDRESSAQLQRDVVAAYPNISAVDITLILEVADRLLSRVAFVIRFMAAFSILTGLVVLAGSLRASRNQRVAESVLLRTLGASRALVTRITRLELLLLALLATTTGAALSVGGSWALTEFVFETDFVVSPLTLGGAFAAVAGVTLLVGLLGGRGIHDRPPLEVLRAEG